LWIETSLSTRFLSTLFERRFPEVAGLRRLALGEPGGAYVAKIGDAHDRDHGTTRWVAGGLFT
jgi:hypothetical protein